MASRGLFLRFLDIIARTGTSLAFLEGFPVRVVWMDLGAAWPDLRDQLVDVVSWCGAVGIAAGKLDAPNPLTSRDDARAEP